MSSSILLVGCGKMGGALLHGWLDRGVQPGDVHVVEPHQEFAGSLIDRGIAFYSELDDMPVGVAPAVVLFAVKPQVMDQVAPAYAKYAGKAVFMSIAAGITSGNLEGWLGADAAVVRVMPNTPAAVGRGISVGYANGAVSQAQKDQCTELMEAAGEFAWADDDGLIDAVTAVSGSGPAYVFLLAECMAEAGRQAGLPADMAALLARATVSGSGELLRQASEDAATLRKNVTSPGGTTEAALSILMGENGLQELMTAAVMKAADRSRELAKG